MAHMINQTQRQYNRSFAGSVGSGMQSLMGGVMIDVIIF